MQDTDALGGAEDCEGHRGSALMHQRFGGHSSSALGDCGSCPGRELRHVTLIPLGFTSNHSSEIRLLFSLCQQPASRHLV